MFISLKTFLVVFNVFVTIILFTIFSFFQDTRSFLLCGDCSHTHTHLLVFPPCSHEKELTGKTQCIFSCESVTGNMLHLLWSTIIHQKCIYKTVNKKKQWWAVSIFSMKSDHGFKYVILPLSSFRQCESVWLLCKQGHLLLFCCIVDRIAAQQVFAVVINHTYSYCSNHDNSSTGLQYDMNTFLLTSFSFPSVMILRCIFKNAVLFI